MFLESRLRTFRLHHLSAFILYASPYTLSSLLVFFPQGRTVEESAACPLSFAFPCRVRGGSWKKMNPGMISALVPCIGLSYALKRFGARRRGRKGGGEGGRNGGKDQRLALTIELDTGLLAGLGSVQFHDRRALQQGGEGD